MLITDLQSWYHPVTTKEPLKVDKNKKGKDSDHLQAVFAPKSDNKFKVERNKIKISTRPLPQSKFPSFGLDIQNQSWIEVYEEENLDRKVENFHNIITTIANKHFPEKVITVTNLDKKWMTPEIKQLLRKVQQEFYLKGKSLKWRNLKSKYRKLKRKSVRSYFSNFVNKVKSSDKSSFYKKVKQIG